MHPTICPLRETQRPTTELASYERNRETARRGLQPFLSAAGVSWLACQECAGDSRAWSKGLIIQDERPGGLQPSVKKMIHIGRPESYNRMPPTTIIQSGRPARETRAP